MSPLNRGFLYGDAVYEVWRTYEGVVFAWEEHWRRLGASAAALHFELPWPPAAILEEIRRTAAAFRAAAPEPGELYIRLQLARGEGAIGLDPALADRPEFVLLVQPLPAAHRGAGRRPACACRSPASSGAIRRPPSTRPGRPATTSTTFSACARRAPAGPTRSVLLNLAGEVTEAAVANIAFVRAGELITPPLRAGILGGITRGLVLGGIAAAAGVAAREETVRPEDFGAMDECLLLSTTKDIVPVAAIDGAQFQVGPGTATARIKAAFAAYAREYARSHAPWRLA